MSGPEGGRVGTARLGRIGRRIGARTMSALEPALGALAVVIASIAYRPFFADDSYLLPVAGAAVLGTLAGQAITRFRRPPGMAWAGAVVAFGLYAVYVLFPESTSSGLPGPASLAAIGDGLANGLARTLTVTPPADPTSELLIVPVALAFVAALWCAVCCAGSNVLLPALAPLLVFVTALLLSANAPEFRWRTTLAFLGCVLVLVLLRANPAPREPAGPAPAEDGRRSRGRAATGRLLFGLPVVAGVTVLAVTATGALPVAAGSNRYDPRATRQAPLAIQDQLNPLVGVREQLLLPTPVAVFTVRADDGGQIPFDRLRTSALDSYDGVQWLSTARFVRTGSTLPAGSPMDDPSTLTVDITLTDAIRSPFLPEFGRAVSVQAAQVGFDSTTGLLATASPDLDGYHYRLTGQYVGTPVDPTTATPDPVGDTELPDLDGDPAAGLRMLAEQWSAGTTTAWDRLTAIATHLRQFSYAPDAAPGHSYAALHRFLDSTDPTVDTRVTEEQTAAAFAVMARSLGYPARVAVGYRLDPQHAVDGAITVTTQDADAWAEVAFAGRGWTAFQVTPPRQGDPPPPPITPQGQDQGTVQPQPPGESGPSATPGTGSVGSATSWAIALAVLIPLLLAIAVVGLIAAAKWWRRHRRSSRGSTTERIMGAWQETADRLTEHGLTVAPSGTPTDVGRHTTERFGDDAGRQVATLAPIVSRALYAPAEPDEAAVVAAWDLESELRAILDARRPWWTAALCWVDPRPLWRHRRRSDATGGRRMRRARRRTAPTDGIRS